MARKYRNDFLAGIFIIVSSILFFLVLLLMGSFETLFAVQKSLRVEFEDVQMLREGDPVYLLGVKVGKVEALSFQTPPGKPMRVLVTIGIPEKYWSSVTDDAKVLIDKSITGNLSVQIRDLQGGPIGASTVLRGRAAFDLVETGTRVQETLEQVTQVVEGVADLLTQVEESGVLQTTLRDISETINVIRNKSAPLTAKVDRIAGLVETMLGENREGIRLAVENLSRSSQLVNRFLERIDPAREALEEAMTGLGEVSERMDRLLASNEGYIAGILKDLRETSATASHLTAEIRRRPWRLLYKPDESELEAIDLYDAAWAYNLTATTLHLSVEELLSLSRAGDRVDPQLLEQAVESVKDSLRRQKEAETRFYSLFQERASG